VRWIDRDGAFACAELEFDGVRRVCHMACVPDVEVGDYAIVHAGVAISRIDVAEADRLLAELAAAGIVDDDTRNDLP
jgi:hydrogenase expression/formation protein HypC